MFQRKNSNPGLKELIKRDTIMKKIMGLLLGSALLFGMTGCSTSPSVESSDTTVATTAVQTTGESVSETTAPKETTVVNDTEAVKSMVLMIGNTEVPVVWEDNASVDELRLLAENELSIDMSMYGGFEQVGSFGQTITSNDSQTTTSPGDIVLYSGDQIVIFYGSNTWSYTKLGKIDLSEEEMEELLSNGDVAITLSLQ